MINYVSIFFRVAIYSCPCASPNYCLFSFQFQAVVASSSRCLVFLSFLLSSKLGNAAAALGPKKNMAPRLNMSDSAIAQNCSIRAARDTKNNKRFRLSFYWQKENIIEIYIYSVNIRNILENKFIVYRK